MGRASIFHESVHALKDVKGWKVPSMQDEEVVAYLADAMYLRANHTHVSGGALEMAQGAPCVSIISARSRTHPHPSGTRHRLQRGGVRISDR
jgi:hypothetical protein